MGDGRHGPAPGVPAPLGGRRPWGKKGPRMEPWGRMPHGRRMAEGRIPLAGPHGVGSEASGSAFAEFPWHGAA